MPSPTLSVRPIDHDDDAALDAYLSQVRLVFTDPVRPDAAAREFFRKRLARQRLTGTYDGDLIVGTYRSWDTGLTVPGGTVLTADAVSTVTVRPTHRRRGVLTGMIGADLAAAAAREVPAAVLVASEATIYGRFGFGVASDAAAWELDVRRARIAPQVPRRGRIEIVEPQAARELLPPVFEAARYPAAMDRAGWWWDTQCEIAPKPGTVIGPRACVVHRDDEGVPRGYAFYTWSDDWHDKQCRTVVHVDDLQASTPDAYAALWTYFAELDLVATVRAAARPVDDPLPWLLTDPRAASRTAVHDMLWLRLLDPAAALTARTYESPGRAVLAVTDPLGHAAGRYLLEAAADGAGKAVRLADATGPAGDAVDVELPVDVLSALYLGAGDLHAAAMAGRVAERSPGAVDRLARLLRTTRAPWTGTMF